MRSQTAVVYTTAPDSPGDCPLCSSPMIRQHGLWQDPDVNGNPILDEQDVCQRPCCGLRLPVVGDEWDRPDVRRHAAAVLNLPARQEATHA